MGYSAAQLAELEATIDATPCDAVLIGTPLDLGRAITVKHPVTRVHYEAVEVGASRLEELLVPLTA